MKNAYLAVLFYGEIEKKDIRKEESEDKYRKKATKRTKREENRFSTAV